MILERITKKEVLKILKLGRRSFKEIIKLVPHATDRHHGRLHNVLGCLFRNHYLVEETVQTGEHVDVESGTKTPIFTMYFWDKPLYERCKCA